MKKSFFVLTLFGASLMSSSIVLAQAERELLPAIKKGEVVNSSAVPVVAYFKKVNLSGAKMKLGIAEELDRRMVDYERLVRYADPVEGNPVCVENSLSDRDLEVIKPSYKVTQKIYPVTIPNLGDVEVYAYLSTSADIKEKKQICYTLALYMLKDGSTATSPLAGAYLQSNLNQIVERYVNDVKNITLTVLRY